VPKIPFLRRVAAALVSNRCTDRPLASSSFYFFLSFSFSNATHPSRFKKCAPGFLASKVLQDPRGINFRNVRPRVSRPLADPTRPVFSICFSADFLFNGRVGEVV
jgi:hypothetical protein